MKRSLTDRAAKFIKRYRIEDGKGFRLKDIDCSDTQSRTGRASG